MDQIPKFVVFQTISTIKDGKSAKFHYIKTVIGKVVVQSIAFRVASIYWQGDDPFPLKSWLKVTHPLLKAARFDTFAAKFHYIKTVSGKVTVAQSLAFLVVSIYSKGTTPSP